MTAVDYGPAIHVVAVAIDEGRLDDAREIALGMPKRIKSREMPGLKAPKGTKASAGRTRAYSQRDLIELFRRDRFMDRYTGLRLVIPPALRVISAVIPEAFPFHPNWKEGECHDSYWDLSATADHVKPVADGGLDDLENLV